jgi:hypothetical protein
MTKTEQEKKLEADVQAAQEKVRSLWQKSNELRARREALALSLDADDILERMRLDQEIEALGLALHAARGRRREASGRLAHYRTWAASKLGRPVHLVYQQAQAEGG